MICSTAILYHIKKLNQSFVIIFFENTHAKCQLYLTLSNIGENGSWCACACVRGHSKVLSNQKVSGLVGVVVFLNQKLSSQCSNLTNQHLVLSVKSSSPSYSISGQLVLSGKQIPSCMSLSCLGVLTSLRNLGFHNLSVRPGWSSSYQSCLRSCSRNCLECHV